MEPGVPNPLEINAFIPIKRKDIVGMIYELFSTVFTSTLRLCIYEIPPADPLSGGTSPAAAGYGRNDIN